MIGLGGCILVLKGSVGGVGRSRGWGHVIYHGDGDRAGLRGNGGSIRLEWEQGGSNENSQCDLKTPSPVQSLTYHIILVHITLQW
jgi:hypothetical protein